VTTDTDTYDFSEAWQMFQGEKEPWKDLDRLLKWEQKLDTQQEMADAFGCSPSTISYWLGKARTERRRQRLEAGELCVRCEENETPGGIDSANRICDACLEEVRGRDRKTRYDNYLEHLQETHG